MINMWPSVLTFVLQMILRSNILALSTIVNWTALLKVSGLFMYN